MDVMAFRRKILTANDFPFGYTKLPYLESTAGAYLMTDVLPSETLGFDCDFMPFGDYTNQTNQFCCIFGGRKASVNNDFQLTTWTDFTPSGSGYTHRHGTFRWGGGQIDAGMVGQNVRQVAKYRDKTYIGPDGVIVHVSAYSWASDRVPICLFALNNNNSAVQQGPGCRIYRIRFYDGDDLIRDYIPAKRKSDQALGMYERITKQFITKSGTGDFTTA